MICFDIISVITFQCNNSYIFPGVGLGVLVSESTRVTDGMLQVASEALAELSPLHQGGQLLLPSLHDIQSVSKHIALAVVKKAIEDGVAQPRTETRILTKLNDMFWQAQYLEYKRIAS